MFSIIDLHDQRLIIYKCIYLSNVAQSMGDGKHITECHLAKTIADYYNLKPITCSDCPKN